MTSNMPLEDNLNATDAAVWKSVIQRAQAQGTLSDEEPVALFMDLEKVQNECKALIDAFAQSKASKCLHGLAVKACPLVGVLKAAAMVGMGGECASEGEVALCLAAGIPPSKIVLDSPCKTDRLLRDMLKLGVHLNADNLAEVQRIQAILNAWNETNGATPLPTPRVGLRLNPQVGQGTIGMTSTAGASNKFGVPLKESKADIIEAFRNHTFLTCVHVHVGSQGVSAQQLVDGAKTAVSLAQEINAAIGHKQVTTIDIGGGLSVDYGKPGEAERLVTMDHYVKLLQDQVPALFDFDIISEFGRRLLAGTGFFGTRVQTVKGDATYTYIVGHVGADLLLRDVYAPQQWRHPLHIYNTNQAVFRGTDEPTAKYHVAGPLCFAGDIIARERVLPSTTQVGDIMVIPMSGAYTMSMYSRHTSQLVPAVYGYQGSDESVALQVLKKAETCEDLVRFWGGGQVN